MEERTVARIWRARIPKDTVTLARERATLRLARREGRVWRSAEEAGVSDRVSFEVATAKGYRGGPFEVICFFDCLHDLGDPVGAARHARGSLAADGMVVLVEPFAGDRVEENLNPIGRLYYAGSTMLCCAHSLSEEVGLALGAQAGEARLAEVFRKAGFGPFRRATQTPFNLVLEARP